MIACSRQRSRSIPKLAPTIVITYGHLDLFRDQLARFGPQVVPIVAAYRGSLTTADALRLRGGPGNRSGAVGGEPRDLSPPHAGGAG